MNLLLKIEKWISHLVNLCHNSLGHLHVGGNHGKRDDHLPIGVGNIRFPEIISALKQSGCNDRLTLEVFCEDRAELKSSQVWFAAMYAAT